MKIKILSTEGEKGSVELPQQFNEPIRIDLIKRAVLSIQSNKRQQYGASPRAGKDYSAKLSRRRRNYRGSYGKGISRVPRKILTRNGMQMHMVGALAPGTVGGRRAHPPKAEKVFERRINDKERRKAIRSALHATIVKEVVEGRGHKTPKNYPFILDNSLETLKKTKEVIEALKKLGLQDELNRAREKKVRAGKGKRRGRRYDRKKGPLLVVGNKCDVIKAARSIPGIDVITVESLNTELLAPGTHPGRLTLYTQNSIERLQKESLFM